MDVLENCAKTCSSADYRQCWVNGLESLNQEHNLNLVNRNALIKLLESNLKKAETQNPAATSSNARE